MVDAKTVELINKDIDELLSPKESQRLKERLSTDSEARNYHNDLVKLSKMLNQVESVDPSPNLKKMILNSIPVHKYQSLESKPPQIKILNFLNFRFAFAFALGLLIGVFTNAFFSHQPLNDDSNLIGAIFLNDKDSEFKPADKIEINSNEINGTLATQSSTGLVLLQIDLTTPPEMELTVEFDKNDLSFAGFRPQKYSGGQINVSSNKLRLVNNGVHQYILVFEDKSETFSQLAVKMFTDKLLYESKLTTRPIAD